VLLAAFVAPHVVNRVVAARPTRDAMAVVGPRLPHERPPIDESPELQGVADAFLWAAARMPPISRRLLVLGEAPATAAADELLKELRLPDGAVSTVAPLHASPGALSPAQCAALRDACDRGASADADSIDGAPDHQLNLDDDGLRALVGDDAVRRLQRLPDLLGVASPGEPRTFVRRYALGGRPWTPFHVDSARVTVNICLGDESANEGGALLALAGGELRVVPRAIGEATVHESSLLHGVARLAAGERYALIMFFGEKAALRCDPAAEAAALAAVVADGAVAAAVGPRWTSLLHSYAGLDDAGARVERVVSRYGAPHLRATDILRRARAGEANGAAASLRALLSYAGQ